jgi:hypothetical protein
MKLNHYGVSGSYLSWFKSYLENRKQKVCLSPDVTDQGTASNWEGISSGVHQGSILGPLLFLIYINDLPSGQQNGSFPVIYKDDTSVLITADNDTELKRKMNDVLDCMTAWLSANGLSLNMENTNIMKYTSSKRQAGNFQLTHHNTVLNGADNVTFLGLQLDNNIKWNNHIHKTVNKLNSACFLLRRMNPIFNTNTLKMIYHAYFHSVMEFGIPFWGVSADSKKVFLQQKRAVRIMTGSPPRASCRKLFRRLKILTVTSQYILFSMRFLASNLEKFTFNSSVHDLNTRHRTKLHKPQVRLKLYQQSLYYSCINIYNHLPDYLAVLILDKKRFLQHVKKYLIDNPFYTMEEFLEY